MNVWPDSMPLSSRFDLSVASISLPVHRLAYSLPILFFPSFFTLSLLFAFKDVLQTDKSFDKVIRRGS